MRDFVRDGLEFLSERLFDEIYAYEMLWVDGSATGNKREVTSMFQLLDQLFPTFRSPGTPEAKIGILVDHMLLLRQTQKIQSNDILSSMGEHSVRHRQCWLHLGAVHSQPSLVVAWEALLQTTREGRPPPRHNWHFSGPWGDGELPEVIEDDRLFFWHLMNHFSESHRPQVENHYTRLCVICARKERQKAENE